MEWYDFLNPNEQPEYICSYCGNPSEKAHCSKECERAEAED